MVSGLCTLTSRTVFIHLYSTLQNDCSYIEHVHFLFCTHLINTFLFLGLLILDNFSIRNA